MLHSPAACMTAGVFLVLGYFKLFYCSALEGVYLAKLRNNYKYWSELLDESISFLVILAIVNSIGLTESAGIGVAEKVCAFIMLVPAAFMQSMSAFVAQNKGAGKIDRAMKGFKSAVAISFTIGVVMFYAAFFHGDMLSGVFSKDADVIIASADYLKAYGIDCLLTCFLFCFIGFFNGMGYTSFVMIQGIIGAYAVRVPVSFLMSKWEPVSLFHIGLATPCSTILQIVLCFGYLFFIRKHRGSKGL